MGVCVTFALLTLPPLSDGNAFLEPRLTPLPCPTMVLLCSGVWQADRAAPSLVAR